MPEGSTYTYINPPAASSPPANFAVFSEEGYLADLALSNGFRWVFISLSTTVLNRSAEIFSQSHPVDEIVKNPPACDEHLPICIFGLSYSFFHRSMLSKTTSRYLVRFLRDGCVTFIEESLHRVISSTLPQNFDFNGNQLQF